MSQINCSSRLLAEATAGVAMVPAASGADVVRVGGPQIHVAFGFAATDMFVGWDVDGDGTDDGTVVAQRYGVGFGVTGSNLSFFDKSFRYPPYQLTMPVFVSSDMIGPAIASNYGLSDK